MSTPHNHVLPIGTDLYGGWPVRAVPTVTLQQAGLAVVEEAGDRSGHQCCDDGAE